MRLTTEEIGMGPLTMREEEIAQRVAMLMHEKMMKWARERVVEQAQKSYQMGREEERLFS